MYTEIAVERLREKNCECQAVQVTISTCNYYSDDINSQYSNGVIVQLPRLTSYTPDIVNAARMALPYIFRKGYGYKVIMVTLLDIMPAQYQGWLWIDPKEDIKKKTTHGCRRPDYKFLRQRFHHPSQILDSRRLADETGSPQSECYYGY